METKLFCNCCQEKLTLENCYTSKDKKYKNRNGFLHKCKSCGDAYRKRYFENNEEAQKRHRLYEAKRRLSNREKYLWNNARNRAKSKDIEFNIDISDVLIPDLCPVFGTPMISSDGNTMGSKDKAPSLDRIDPNKGYIKGNIIVMSNRANLLKSNGTLEEFELLLSWLKKQKE